MRADVSRTAYSSAILSAAVVREMSGSHNTGTKRSASPRSVWSLPGQPRQGRRHEHHDHHPRDPPVPRRVPAGRPRRPPRAPAAHLYAPAAPGESCMYGTPVPTWATWSSAGRRSTRRAVEASANAHPNFLTEVDGQTIHFIHVRSEVPGVLPLLLAHPDPVPSPQSLDMIGPLTHLVADGADRARGRVPRRRPGRCLASASPPPWWTAARRWPGWRARTTR